MKGLALRVFVWVQVFATKIGVIGLLLLGWVVVIDWVKGFIRSIKKAPY